MLSAHSQPAKLILAVAALAAFGAPAAGATFGS
jgi:hypothetical protein